MVLEAALMHVWLKEGGRVVGHPPTPGEKLKEREEAETFGNSKEVSRCIPGGKKKKASPLRISNLPMLLLW